MTTTRSITAIDDIPVICADWHNELPGFHVYRSRDIPETRRAYMWFVEYPDGTTKHVDSSDTARHIAWMPEPLTITSDDSAILVSVCNMCGQDAAELIDGACQDCLHDAPPIGLRPGNRCPHCQLSILLPAHDALKGHAWCPNLDCRYVTASGKYQEAGLGRQACLHADPPYTGADLPSREELYGDSPAKGSHDGANHCRQCGNWLSPNEAAAGAGILCDACLIDAYDDACEDPDPDAYARDLELQDWEQYGNGEDTPPTPEDDASWGNRGGGTYHNARNPYLRPPDATYGVTEAEFRALGMDDDDKAVCQRMNDGCRKQWYVERA